MPWQVPSPKWRHSTKLLSVTCRKDVVDYSCDESFRVGLYYIVAFERTKNASFESRRRKDGIKSIGTM